MIPQIGSESETLTRRTSAARFAVYLIFKYNDPIPRNCKNIVMKIVRWVCGGNSPTNRIMENDALSSNIPEDSKHGKQEK
ncbi:hypothetical protein AVEN_254302-1 [Araneus ventricosus]|uniref:Uncharacterized protein n=1 Tax=Araneus ventricosus TaxID=182803 RepID=A0A4Y2FD54_ARAVE|nr:hypothetical protein AVEN_254302-1 [Araneus ventricosus]